MSWLYRIIVGCLFCLASIVSSANAGTLAASLDNTLTWTTGGNAVWADQAVTTHDGVDAAQSGAILDLQTSWVETTVTAPAQVSFWWQVSSEVDFDFLSVAVDGVEQGGAAAPISGEVAWVQVTVNVPGTGPHTVRWQYMKDGSYGAGQDGGWLDQVVVTNAVDADNDGYNSSVDCNDNDNTVHATLFGYADADGDTYTSGAAQSLCTAGTLPVGYVATQKGEDCNDAAAGINPAAAEIPNDGTDQDCTGRDATATILDSLDLPALTWTFAGNVNWDGQLATSQDLVDAAQSGIIGDSQSSEIQTQITGPGLVTYWWKVSSELNADFLTVYVDNVAQTGAAAAISGEVPWTQVTLTLPAGAHTIRWVYSKDASLAAGSDSAWLDVVAISADVDADGDGFLSSVDCNDAAATIYPGAPEGINDGIDQDCSGRDSQATIAEGLDLSAGAATWTMGGNVNWDGRTDITHDAADSGQSGVITGLQSSEVSTNITGPTVLSFWWKVSSEANFDTLQVAIDGVVQATISGEVNWTQNLLNIPAGPHTVKWSYVKDVTTSIGSDCAWLDQVTTGSAATVPNVPTGVSAVAGNGQAVVTFTPPSSDGGSPITGYTVTSSPAGGVDSNAGQPGTTHTITGLTNGLAYTFTVVATNGVGNSLNSAASAAVTPVLSGASVPGAPTTVSAVAGDAQATVSFVAPAVDGGSAITGYTVTSIPGGGVDSNAGTTGLSHVVSGLTNGVSYTFTVTATNVAGTGASSVASNSVFPMGNQVIAVTTPAPTTATYYGQFTVAATSLGGPVTYNSGSPTICTSIGATFTMIASSGTCVVLYDQVGSATYNPAPQLSVNVTAQPAVLTVTADALNKTYGSVNPLLTYTVNGFMNGDTAAVVSGAPVLSTTATDLSPTGSYPITTVAGNMSATNYLFSYVDGILTVAKATLTVTADAKSKTYGSANPLFTYTVTNFLNGDTAAVISGAPTLSTAATGASPAGSYPIAAAAGNMSATNYLFSYADGLLTVDKATLAVTADLKSKTFGTPNPPLTYTVTGFVNGDTAAVISGAPSLSTAATDTSPVSGYPITVAANNLSATNYVFSYVNSLLIVGAAPVTTATPGGGAYNGAINVVLSSVPANSNIYYSTDPAPLTVANAQVYSGPITIPVTATLQFFAIDLDLYQESVQSVNYTIASTDLSGSVQINNGAAFTQNVNVNLTLAAFDPEGVKAYMLSNDNITYQTVAITPSANLSATVPWILPAGDGLKTVYVKYVDTPTPNNVYGPFTAEVTLDTAAPLTTASTPTGVYNGAINVVLASEPNATIYYSTNVTPLTTANGQIYTGPITMSSTATLQFMAIDQAQNQESIQSRSYTIVGTDLTGSVQINNGNSFTNNSAVNLTLAAIDPEGIKAYMLSNDGVNYQTVTIDPPSANFSATVPWNLPVGDGPKTIYVKYVDTPTPNNTYGPFTAVVTLDTFAPTTTALPPTGTYNGAISVVLTSEPAATIYYTTSANPLTVANGQIYTGAIDIPATATLQFMAVDQANNQEAVQSRTYTIVGTDLTGSVQINNGAAFTNNGVVSLTLAASDPEGIKAYMLSNDGVIYQTVAINPSSTNFSATVPWTLPAGDGLKTVYVKYVDTPTPNNIYGPFTADITLDTAAPTTTATPAEGTYNGAINVALASEPGATIYYTTAVEPLTTANGQVYSGPITISTTSTLQFMAVDQASNLAAAQSRTYTIVGNDLAGGVQINNGAGFTNNGLVNLTLAAIDPEGVKSYMLSNDGVTYQTFSINPTTSNFSATVPWTLPAGDGLKTVYVKYVDTPTPNNVYGPFTADITLDTVAPITTANPDSGAYNGAINVALASEPSATIYYTTAVETLTTANGQVYSGPITISTTSTLQFMAIDQAQNQEAVQSQAYTIAGTDLTGSVQINNGAAFTNNGAVNLTLAAIDPEGIKSYMLSNDGVTYQTVAITPSSPNFSATVPWTLSAGNGLKTVYVKYVDTPTPNNVYGPFTAEITLDTVAPVTTATPASGAYNGAINVVLASELNATIYYTTAVEPLTVTNGQVYSGPITVSTTSTLKFMAIDQAQNQEAVQSRNYTIAGMDLVGSVQINNGAAFTNNGTVNLTLAAIDPEGIKSYMLSNDGVTYQTVSINPASTNFSTTVPWILSAGNGLKTVYVKYVDTPTPNNVYGPFTAEITLDTEAPTTTATPASGVYNGSINVVLTSEPNSTIYYTTAAELLTTANGQVYSGPITIPTSSTLQFMAIDQAQNQEAVQSRTYTIAGADLVGSVQINNGAAFTNNGTVNLTLAAIDPEGIKSYMLSNDGVTYQTVAIDPSATNFSATVPWILSAGDGLKTVYVKYVDTPTPNNVYGPFTAEITLDTEAPVTTATPASGAYNGAINVVLASDLNATIYYTTAVEPLTVANGQVYSGPITISTTSTLKFMAIDQAQNQEAVQSRNYTIAGTDLVGSVQINDGAAFTNNGVVNLKLAAIDPEGIKAYMLSNDGVTYQTVAINPSATNFSATVPWTLSAGNGLKTVYVKYVDTPTPNNLYGPFTAEITLDTEAPVTTATPASGAYNGAINVVLASEPSATIYYTTTAGPLTTANGQAYSGPITIPTTSTLQFMAIDQAQNQEAVQSRTYTIAGTDLDGSVQINDGAAFTNNGVVNLKLAAIDPEGVKAYMLSNDGVTYQTVAINPSSTNFSAAVPWTLSAGNGPKMVYVKYVDTPTPNNVYGPFIADIILDTEAPVTTATPASGTFNGAINVDLASEPSATIYYTTAVEPLTVANGQVYSGPITISTTSTLQFMAIDQAQNQEAVQSRTYTIAGTDLVGSVQIDNGAAFTNNSTVNLTLTALDPEGVKAYMLSNDGVTYQTVAIDLSPTNFSATVPWTLSTGNGPKMVYVKYVDTPTPNNVYGPFIADITLDTEAPVTTATPTSGAYNGAINVVLASEPNATIYYTTVVEPLTTANGQVYSGPITISTTATLQFMAIDQAQNQEAVQSRTYTIAGADLVGSVQINNGDAFTNNSAVNLTLSAIDPEGVNSYMLSNDGVTYQTVALNPSSTSFSATVPWTLSAGNGLKTVYVKYVDTPTPNNVYGPFTAEITLDTEAPETTATPASGAYNGAINIVLASEPNSTVYYTTAVGPLTTVNGQVYSGPITIPTTSTLQFMAIDQAQNQEAVQSRTYTIVGTDLDGSVQINNGAAFTNNGAVNLKLAALDPEGIKAYMLSNDGVTYQTVAIDPSSTNFSATIPWILSAGNGLKTVYVKYVDTPTPNNVYGPFTAEITLDTEAPVTTAIPASGTYNGAINVVLTSEPSATIYYTTAVGPLTTANGQVYSGPITIPTTATLQFMAIDQAQNQEAVQSRTYTIAGTDLTGSVQINNGAAFTNNSTVNLTLAALDPEGIKAYMLSNDGVTYQTVAINPSSTNFSATVLWTLPAGNGLKTVYVKYVDTPTPNNVYGPFTAEITLDTEAPVTTATPASGTYNGAINIVLASEPNVTIYYKTAVGPLTAANGQVYNGPITIPTTSTLQFMAIDQAQNQEAVQSRTYTIAGTDLTGSVQINNGAAFTNNGTVNLKLAALDPEGIKAYMLSNDGVTYQTVAINPSATNFSATVPWALSAGNGLKTVYVKYVDTPTPNNIYGPFTAEITLDTEAPVTTATPASGTYNGAINVVLASEPSATIYYTTAVGPLTIANGQVYSGPISISTTSTLQFMAIDQAQNQEAVQSRTYTIIPQGTSIELNLGSGWNLIASLEPIVADSFALAHPEIISLWKYEFGTWSVYLNNGTTIAYATSKGFGILDTINQGEGFWVNVQVPLILTFQSIDVVESLSLVEGWSLRGLKGKAALSIPEMQTLAGAQSFTVTSVWKWSNNGWFVTLPGKTDLGQDYANSKGFTLLTVVNPGEGFWVNALALPAN